MICEKAKINILAVKPVKNVDCREMFLNQKHFITLLARLPSPTAPRSSLVVRHPAPVTIHPSPVSLRLAPSLVSSVFTYYHKDQMEPLDSKI